YDAKFISYVGTVTLLITKTGGPYFCHVHSVDALKKELEDF
ncbi:unnamed protein product, partial [marine sediment metagenome]